MCIICSKTGWRAGSRSVCDKAFQIVGANGAESVCSWHKKLPPLHHDKNDIARYENPSQSISVIMDSELQRVSLADDDGYTQPNEGNFVELVRFRPKQVSVLSSAPC